MTAESVAQWAVDLGMSREQDRLSLIYAMKNFPSVRLPIERAIETQRTIDQLFFEDQMKAADTNAFLQALIDKVTELKAKQAASLETDGNTSPLLSRLAVALGAPDPTAPMAPEPTTVTAGK